ncbi:VPLPA-CTERM sorting domain-containing protein [Amaricoccus sp.]|uniref:VPLPA-CTERM sorting domain-containing protein n=1 Tax=Amaricoccus sp. TaxID=1872485 RepID=UPI001B524DBE|nr:VPLPA-CTERM sorting domain-containing protein [Amaricoccus sp.]MBP7001844.1 VPLPA-CTERM sorting domain-containing protein [Amaricoccus sp.]
MRAVFAALTLCFAYEPAHATSFVSAGSFVDVLTAGGPVSESDFQLTFDTINEGRSRATAVGVVADGVGIASGAFANAETGRFGSSISKDASDAAPGEVSGGGGFGSTLTFAGSGQVRYRLDFRYKWDVKPAPAAATPGFFSNALVQIVDQQGMIVRQDEFVFEPWFESTAEPTSGLLKSYVEVVMDVADGDRFDWVVGGDTILGPGAWGALGMKGRASVWASDGVAIAFEDPEFMTRATPAPVPLPAGGWLLMGGVATFGVFRRRLRRSSCGG